MRCHCKTLTGPDQLFWGELEGSKDDEIKLINNEVTDEREALTNKVVTECYY